MNYAKPVVSIMNVDGYQEPFYKVVHQLWQGNYGCLLELVVGHNLGLQLDQTKISDLSVFPLPPKTNCLVIKSVDDKYYSCIRGRDLWSCPHAAIAAYLFWRIHLLDEFPNGRVPSVGSFYESSLFQSRNPDEMKLVLSHTSPNYLIEDLKKGFSEINLPCSNSISLLPEDAIYKRAGFSSRSNYTIPRDVIDPPEQLLQQIFPFIDEELNNRDILTIRMLNVFRMLRRSFVQDMVLLRRKFPDGLISQHPIFKSDLFNEFARRVEDLGVGLQSPAPSITPPPAADIKMLTELQRTNQIQIQQLQNQLELCMSQQANMYKEFQEYIRQQKEIKTKEEQVSPRPPLPSMLGSMPMHMLSHLSPNQTPPNIASLQGQMSNIPIQPHNLGQLQSTNPVSNPNANQSPNQVANPGLNQAPHQVPNQVPNQAPHQAPHQAPNQAPHQAPNQAPHQAPNQVPNPVPHQLAHPLPHQMPNQMPPSMSMKQIPLPPGMVMPGMQFPISQYPMPIMTSLPPSMIPSNAPTPNIMGEDESSIRRRKALNRRLSRQAINVYEMWDDFKSLEKELEDNGVSITEWLKLHGSSERQFRHTRQKIIRFIDEEAKRTNCMVDQIKDKLHNKMRNRVKPWTLDEVQRMLTSGKRIQLD